MALDVQLKCLGIFGARRARVEFRGVHYYTRTLGGEEADGSVCLNENLQWLLASGLGAGELLTMEVYSGRWARRIAGRLQISLDAVANSPGTRQKLSAPLMDHRRRPLQTSAVMEIEYTPPERSASFLGPDNPPDEIQQSEDDRMSDDAAALEESMLLESIKLNIDRMHDRITSREAEPIRPPEIKTEPDPKQSYRSRLNFRSGDGKRSTTMRTVKNLMRLGKLGKRRPSACSSSTDDEERGMLSPPINLNQSDVQTDDSEKNSPDEQSVASIPESYPVVRKPIPNLHTLGHSHLKAQDFQVCLTILEARQLAGINMDPVVCIQVGDQRKYTSVKESTNCPYYNEYFVFDFHMPPILLFDKIITLTVLQSRNMFRPHRMLGSFKLDVGTAWAQPDHQFYHKWAVLTDPIDLASGVKGYLKCDISVIGKGDSIIIPPKSEKEDEDIESNLLLPEGVSAERQRARYSVRIHKADGLPKMNLSIMANMKKAFTGESSDLVDPYVQVCFAGLSGCTSVRKNSYNPVWNEQIVFTDMFPPLCQRMRIQLRDQDPVKPSIIGTHYIDLKSISNDGERGFLPTFGPSYIYLYGSPRDYSLLDQHAALNAGFGEGVSYRARILISIRTEVTDNPEAAQSAVEVEGCAPPSEYCCAPEEDFLLFATIFDACMIDKKMCEKPISFEISMGNHGNFIDGYNAPSRTGDSPALAHSESTTQPTRAMSHDRSHYFLPYWERKPCMYVISPWPDHSARLHTSNILEGIYECLEDGLRRTAESTGDEAVKLLRATLNDLHSGCARFLELRQTPAKTATTDLDRRRGELIVREMSNMSAKSRHLKAIVTKSSFKDRLKATQAFLAKLKFLVDDPQAALPDVVLWAIGGNKRLAYQRIPARQLIFSTVPEEKGKLCGKSQTMFLKFPGKKADGVSGWSIPTKLLIYMWLGLKKDKQHFPEGLPGGYQLCRELKQADRPEVNPPVIISYVEQHNFQLRAYIYQARSLIGSDASGLSDPFARILAGEYCKVTRVIDETLSPTWDQTFLFDDISLYGSMEQIKADPMIIIIEVFDQDQMGKSEFIGRAMAKPRVKALEDPYVKPQFPPALEWYEVTRGLNHAGELLATFELLEVGKGESGELGHPPDVPPLPPPVEGTEIVPVPTVIRPSLANYRIEVLFWGLRDLKRVHLLTVDKPRVDIECAGNILYSSIIPSAKKNSNFSCSVKFLDLELPEQELYRPPLTIRVVDCRSFGRYTLVGTHTINSIHRYVYNFPNARSRELEERRRTVMRRQELDNDNVHTLLQETKVQMENEQENAPLLFKDVVPLYGTNPNAKKVGKNEEPGKSKQSEENQDDEEGSRDWWTKYFASVELMIEKDKEAKMLAQKKKNNSLSLFSDMENNAVLNLPTKPYSKDKKHKFKAVSNAAKFANRLSPVHMNKKTIPPSALCQIYPGELELQLEFEEFKDWLLSFDLFRGKKTEDEAEDENRVVGSFKGSIKFYKWPAALTAEDRAYLGFDPQFGVFQNMPSNDPIQVLVRVYIVKANDLHPMDLNGKADPYIVVQVGPKRFTDKENYISKQLNPIFGKCFEAEATFPRDSMITVRVQDWDLVGSDDIIGETKIDIENRFYSRHRATCGLPRQYEEEGFNRWRDSMKPSQILAKLCKDGKVEPPSYELGRVRIGKHVFEFGQEELEGWSYSEGRQKEMDEKLALNVLHRWQEMPRIGCHLVPEHIETRPLYHPHKPGIERGKLEMWIDMFPMDLPPPGPPIDISPRKPKSYELRIIIWNTDDVVLEDDAFFTGEKMSDIYVKGWLKGQEDCQSTDIHYRSLTGEGNFNWRFVFPFDYLVAEEKIVISRKESLFSWDETESKVPARLEFQVWDADHFSADDFLGAITLDLNRFPRGAKSSKLCTLKMLKMDGSVPTVNIFKQRRLKGWWPFYVKKENDELELTGKMEAEIHLLTREEADKSPVGLGRSEPDPLDRPSRPDGSFMWFLNPLKSIRYIVWHNYKWKVLKVLLVFGLALLFFLFFYSFPGYAAKRALGA